MLQKIIDKFSRTNDWKRPVVEAYFKTCEMKGFIHFGFSRTQNDNELVWEIFPLHEEPTNFFVQSEGGGYVISDEDAYDMRWIFENALGYIFVDKAPEYLHGISVESLGLTKLSSKNDHVLEALALLESIHNRALELSNSDIEQFNLPKNPKVENLTSRVNHFTVRSDGRIKYTPPIV